MGELTASFGYLLLSACIFGVIFFGLFKWNNEKTISCEEQKERV